MLAKGTLNILILVIMISSLLGACQGGLIKPSQHRVGDVLEGTYTVYFRDILIGHLILSDDRYSYKPRDNQEMTEDERKMADLAAKIIFFGRYPNGSLEKEYYGSVNQNTALEDLESGDILVDITFNDDATEDNRKEHGMDRAFVIASYKENNVLRLMPVAATAERWYISKSWE